jgi:hypothetical protein
MFDLFFWRESAERATKTAAQALILAVGASEGFDLFALDWRNAIGVAAGGFVLSILTSLASAPFGGEWAKGSPALWSPIPKDYKV